LAATIMVQIGRRGIARRLFETSKNSQKSQNSNFKILVNRFSVCVSCVLQKKFRLDSNETAEEIHFEVCHSGKLPSIVADRSVLRAAAVLAACRRAAALDDRELRIQKCCVRIVPRILTTDPRTGGIQNWGRNRAVKTHRFVGLSVTLVSRAKTAAPIEMPFGLRTRVSTRNHVLDGVQIPMGRGNFLGKGRPIVKYRDTLRSPVRKRLNRSRCRLGCGLEWAQGIMCLMGTQRC